MSNNRRKVLTTLCIALSIIMLPTPAEAQFLQKLSKGLEKVNKGLEKVDKALGNDNSKQQNSSTNQPAGTVTDTKSVSVNESGWKTFSTVTTPYITSRTMYMSLDRNRNSNVYEGIFGVRMRNNRIAFWTVDGEKLFNADWEYCGRGYGLDFPEFSGGVAPARRAEDKRICLLYADGSVRECDPAWEAVTNFKDGLAVVCSKLGYNKTYFYINAAGKKMFPALKLGDPINNDEMRPLNDGLRAYYSADNNQWGYIDRAGNVKLAAKYKFARDFSEGFAWVAITDEKERWNSEAHLIDKAGNIVFSPGLHGNFLNQVGDVQCGIFTVEKDNRIVYYDTTGRELAWAKGGNSFYDGKAIIYGPSSIPGISEIAATVVNTNFQPLGVISTKILPLYKVQQSLTFAPLGVACLNDYYMDSMGNLVIEEFDSHNGTYIHGFRQFTPDGYAKCEDLNIKHIYGSGLIRPNGEIAWVFSDNTNIVGPYTSNDDLPVKEPEPEPEPIEDEPGKLRPQPIYELRPGEEVKLTEVNLNQTPRGPKEVIPVSFKVTTAANPSDGGTVSLTPQGPFGYGDFATVTAAPNKDWAITRVTTDVEGLTAPALDKPFAVLANQQITVNFVKKDIDDAPGFTGTFHGSLPMGNCGEVFYNIPVYLELSSDANVSTPYGENTYGFLALMFDPAKRYTDKKQTFAVNLFAAPLKVCGVHTDPASGRKWLVLDGGAASASNIKMGGDDGNPIAMLMSMMMGADGLSSLNAKPRHYRVEMLDIDPETGEFTCGPLQTFSAAAGGWLSGDDPSLAVTKRGFFGSSTDKGYPADTFDKMRFKKGSKRTDVHWYPTENWGKDKNMYQLMIESMGASYRSAQSDYEKLFDNTSK